MNVFKAIFSLVASYALAASAHAGSVADAVNDPTIGGYMYFAALDQRCPETDPVRAAALADFKATFIIRRRAVASSLPEKREAILKAADLLEKNGPERDELARFDPYFAAQSPGQIALLCKMAAQDMRDRMLLVQAFLRAEEANKASPRQSALASAATAISLRPVPAPVVHFGKPHDAEDVADNDPPISTNEEVVFVEAHPPIPAVLQVTIMKPDGPGPFPLVIINHGSIGSIAPALQTRYRHNQAAYYFLARGYAVATPMMRGYAGSTGRQTQAGCSQEVLGLGNALDIDSVIETMRRQPYVDPNKVVVAGASFGGWNTLAYGALDRSYVKGLINFSGGVLIDSCINGITELEVAAADYGKASHTPSIWFYGDNDSLFSNELWHTMHERYTAAGGTAELVDIGRFLKDSHSILSYPEALPLWSGALDTFLASIGMPVRLQYPAYLPSAFPAASHYAALEDIGALPDANDSMRKNYKLFLAVPAPRAFFVAPGGWSWVAAGGFDLLARGKKTCAEQHQQCQVYAVDDTVTWVKPPPGPPASSDAELNNLDAVPYMTESGKQAYRQFLTLRGLRAFAVAKDGGYGFAAGGNAAADAMASCGKDHKDCKLYVVDHSIIWK